MSFTLHGLATALPPLGLDQNRLAEIAHHLTCHTPGQQRQLSRLYRLSGVHRRHSVVLEQSHDQLIHHESFYPAVCDLDDRGPSTAARMQRYRTEATSLALDASTHALHNAHTDPAEITHLVTVSCTGFQAPGVDIDLIQQLHLPATVQRTHVGFMGCHGAFNGLRIAAAIAGAQPDARILVCCVELCSLHLGYGWDTRRIVAESLFADGAAAVVGSGRKPQSENGSGPWRLIDNASNLMPDSRDAMTWSIGDHGFEMTLSARVPELIEANLCPWLDRWLARHNLTVPAVGCWAVHPGGPRVLASVGRALDVHNDALADSLYILSECGNMSSPTILFIIDRLRRAAAPRPCVALGFGPGLTAEAMLFN
jgi:predicted naringenin-chalcone synthase